MVHSGVLGGPPSRGEKRKSKAGREGKIAGSAAGTRAARTWPRDGQRDGVFALAPSTVPKESDPGRLGGRSQEPLRFLSRIEFIDISYAEMIK
jgi:hypothetical protein